MFCENFLNIDSAEICQSVKPCYVKKNNTNNNKKGTRTTGALLSVLFAQCVYLIIQFCNLIYRIGTHISSNFELKLPKPEWSSSKLTRSYTSQRQEPLCLTCILNIASSHLLQMTFPQTIFQRIRTRLKRLSSPSSICTPCLTGCRERERTQLTEKVKPHSWGPACQCKLYLGIKNNNQKKTYSRCV